MQVAATGYSNIRSYEVLTREARGRTPVGGSSSDVDSRKPASDSIMMDKMSNMAGLQKAFVAALRTTETIQDRALLDFVR
jgi:hypothetical protein